MSTNVYSKSFSTQSALGGLPFKKIALAVMVGTLAACSDSAPSSDNADTTLAANTDPTVVVPVTVTGENQTAKPITPITDEVTDPVVDVVTDNNTDNTVDNGNGNTDASNEPVEPGVDANDFFGRGLEVDWEEPVAGGPPTTPKNLRADLVGNDWVKLNWAPSNDDEAVVAYRIYRGDGVVYDVQSSAVSSDVETSRTLRMFWETTTFVDCNFTHIRSCTDNGTVPEPGSLHSYQVSALDMQGNESPRSNSIEVRFHEEQGATITKFADPYLDGNDDFQFETDLSNTSNFMDQFEMVFSDEFSGSEIDPNKWSTTLTWRQEEQNIINGEMQYFVDTQSDPDFGYNPFVMTGETLKISAIKTPPELSEKALGQPFLSGALSTHEDKSGQLDSNGNLINDKFGTTYGYVEGRIKVGTVPGMLTSFYLFRRWEGEQAPEIDIVEYLGRNPYGDEKAFQTYHYKDVVHEETLSSPTMMYPRDSGNFGDIKDVNDFHTYGVLWEPNLIVWYIDGQEVQRLTGPQVARQSMNIILYLVTGSAWAERPADNAAYPLEVEIDYVRAYKRKPWQG